MKIKRIFHAYDDRPGAIRDELIGMVRAWQDALHRCVQQAVKKEHLHAETDPQQFVYEMHALTLALHHAARLMRRPGSADCAHHGFECLLDVYRNRQCKDL